MRSLASCRRLLPPFAGRARSHKEVPKRPEELALAFLRQGERSAVMFLQQPQKVPPHAASAGGGVHHHPRQGVAVEQRHRHRRAVEMGGGHRAPGVQGLAQFGGVIRVVAQHFAEALRQFRVGGMKFKTDRHSVSANR